MKPLTGLLVLDFSQFLAGPSAALRLADLGARVIKIERPGTGESGRQLTIKNLTKNGQSVLFNTINRNKESIGLNLKDAHDKRKVEKLIEKADVLIENFRPGVMQKLGLDYERVKELNPRLIYATVTGYGNTGPWKDKPGQDLLVQARSGLTFLNGNADDPPTPFALSIADMLTGAHLVQGILACLVRRGRTGEGGRVEVSLLESILDFQFEVLTTYMNDGGKLPQRSKINNAHAYLGAPYGIYATKDGYLALAMGSVVTLGELLDCPALLEYQDPDSWFDCRDEIKAILVEHLEKQTTRYWLDRLEPADYWCAEVLNWDQLLADEGFKALNMIQKLTHPTGLEITTTRCPIRIDGELLLSDKAAPLVGEHTESIIEEFDLE